MTPLEKNDNPEVVKAVTDLIAKIKMGKLKGSLQIALETLNVLEEIISQADNANAYELVSRLRLAGGLLRRALPGRAPANVARRVLRAVRHETCAPDQSEAAAGESLQQLVLARPARRGTLGAARDLREPVRDHLAELRLELESTVSGISCQAAQHIDSDSVVLCALATPLAEAFLRAASRPYRLLLPEGPEPRQTHSLAARLSEAGVAVTVVSNAAVFAVMSRVTKVVVPAGAVLSGGGVLAAPGAHNVACAAHHHNVPVLVLCPLYKLCPLLPHAPHTYQELASPGGEVEAPASDFLTPDQVTLFLTNTGGSSPSYIYRTMSELYDPADNELTHTMARCRRKRKMCKTRCRTRRGRFKHCRSGDRRYRVRQACCRRRRSCGRRRRRRSCGRRPRYMWRCRSRSGSFKRCRRCDRRFRIRRSRSRRRRR